MDSSDQKGHLREIDWPVKDGLKFVIDCDPKGGEYDNPAVGGETSEIESEYSDEEDGQASADPSYRSVWSTGSSNMPLRHKKNTNDQGILHALLPGARLQKHTKKILVHTSTSNETIRFNIGGTVFETFKATLRGIPNRLASDDFLSKHYREEQQDYFFDRDPEIFHCILNYLRSGELHLPTSVCGPVVKSELEFWGIEETAIEECCWSRYSTWAKALQELRNLERDRKKTMLQWEIPLLPGHIRGWRRFKVDAWSFFSNPSSSSRAQIYGYLCMLLISVSILCFVARTHVDFQIEETVSVAAPHDDLIAKNISINATASVTNSSSLVEQGNSSQHSSLPTRVTETEIEMVPHPALRYVDIALFLFFAIELIARFAVCPRRIEFLLTSMTFVEIMALLPDVIGLIVPSNDDLGDFHTVLEVLHLFRVFRIFRLMRQMPGLWILVYTLKSSIKDLFLLLLFLCVGTLVFSTLVYFAEKSTQDSFSSIPKCFWWSVITMTTVGYGDMFPVTKLGYLIGTVTAISGLLMVGFTVPVLVNNFILYYNHTESHIEREKQREKSLKRTNFHLLSRAASELQQSGGCGGSGRRRMELNFGTMIAPIPEDDREKKDSFDKEITQEDTNKDIRSEYNNNKSATVNIHTESNGEWGNRDHREQNDSNSISISNAISVDDGNTTNL